MSRACAVAAQSAPLLVEEKLDGLLDGEFAAALVHEAAESAALPLRVFDRPIVPADIVVAFAEAR